jgi:hypothetical protein
MFKLKETTMTIRDQELRVKELTHAERLQWMQIAQADRLDGPAMLVVLGVISEPPLTKEEVQGWPGEVVTEVSAKVMELSGMNRQKEPNTRGAVPVPANSGDGAASQSA